MSFAVFETDTEDRPTGRRGSRKSKTGCLTCKKRRVKCDEGKPYCQRCALGGHFCQGYEDVFVSGRVTTMTRTSRSPSARASSPLSRSVTPLQLDASDLRSFHYFSAELSSKLGGSLDTAFWTGPVLQISHSEPAVRQALLAVSTLHEHMSQSRHSPDGTLSSTATQQYSKALTSTAQRVAEGDGDVVALTTCILFLCFEFIQRNENGAFMLLSRGANISQMLLRNATRLPSSYKTLFESSILPLFERLTVLSALFGYPTPPFPRQWADRLTTSDGTPITFTRLGEARDMLYWQMVNGHDMIARARPYRDGVENSQEEFEALRQEQQRHQHILETWLTAFNELLAVSRGDRREKRQEATLRMYYAISRAWLSCALEPLETSYDDQLDLFETLVDAAEQVEELAGEEGGSQPRFTFEMGVIPPLYMTILKCRNAGVRDRAFRQLYRAPHQESLWRRDQAISVTTRALEIESELSQKRMPGATEELPTSGRLSEVQIFLEPDGRTQMWFHIKLDGCGEVHRSWVEYLT